MAAATRGSGDDPVRQRRGTPRPRGNERPKGKTSQRPATPSTRKPSRAPVEPEQVARAAVAHEAHAIPSAPEKVKLTLNIFLNREQAERLTARAIREGKNLEALVAEILETTEKG